MYLNSIIESVGNTPLVKHQTISKEISGIVLVKVEYFNPGNSIKDRRIAIKMIEDAEKEGLLKPGGTIVEGTSGNTGVGLALVAIAKGYKCIFTTTDKQSQSKIDILKAMGAEVLVCPTNVEPEDPKVTIRLLRGWQGKQKIAFTLINMIIRSNLIAHYESTGPELWDQTEGKITHYVAGMGTGGTISGVGKYLKERNSEIKKLLELIL